MRLRRLDLMRYGHFTDRFLDFPAGPADIHLIYGPNEAGKSTTLKAIEDLLFGIDERTALGFLHPGTTMRIGAVLEDGENRLEIIRRKGRKDTLLGPDELPVAGGEGALRPFLGGADPAFFTRMFSLDHTRLEEGGRAILDADDDIGRMLFSAGAGISGLSDTLAALDKDADGLWGARRAGRRLYTQAEERFTEAKTRLRDHTLTAAKWQELKRAFDQAEAAHEAARMQHEEATVRARRLGRIRRTVRFVREKRQAEEAIAALGDVILLPQDAAAMLAEAERKTAEAATRIDAVAREIETGRERLAARVPDTGLLARGGDIRQLHERRIEIRGEKADLPKRQAELDGAEAALRAHGRDLGWDDADVETLIGRIPARADVALVRDLVAERGDCLSAITGLKAGVEEDEARLDELVRRRSSLGRMADGEGLAAAIRAARESGDLAGALATAEADLAHAGERLHRIRVRLHPAVGEDEAALAFAMPSADEVLRFRDRLRETETRLRALDDAIGDAETARREAADMHARAAGAPDVVTEEELAAARARRDELWRDLRSAYMSDGEIWPAGQGEDGECAGREAAGREAAGREVAGRDVAGREVAGGGTAGREAAGIDAAGGDVAGRSAAGSDGTGSEGADGDRAGGAGLAGAARADAFAAAVAGADALADRRFAGAEAVARLAEAARALAAAEARCGRLADDKAVLEAEARARSAAWAELWAAAPFAPLSPDAMLGWLETAEAVRTATEARADAASAVGLWRRRVRDAREALIGACVALGEDRAALEAESLPVVLARAEDHRARLVRLAEQRTALDEAALEAEAAVARRRRELARAEEALSDWRQRWQVASVPFGREAMPDQVAVRLETVDRMREIAERYRSLRHERIEKILRDVAAFETDASALVAALAPDLASLPADDAVLALEERLREAARVDELRRSAEATVARLEAQRQSLNAESRAAGETLAHLYEAAGVADIDALRAAIEASDRLRGLQADLGRALEALREAGDGFPVADLEAECAGVDPDRIAAEAGDADGELATALEALQQARDARLVARRAYEAVGGDDAAAAAEADRQAALADMRAAAERYVRVKGSALLLRWAIDRYRRDKQGPLLRRAEALFAAMTGGSFRELLVGYDDKDAVRLDGVRASGDPVLLAGMSTGTADQLYLALRIAAIEDYLERATALPFVADDLFINFDDARAAAGLVALGDLSTRTQVLVFTHHRHLVELARATLGEAVNVVALDAAVPV